MKKLKPFIASLRRHQFFTLSSGIVGANLIGILTMPFLTRLYPVEAFGYFAIYSAISFIAGMFSTLRFDLALPLIKEEREADRVTALALLLIGAVSIAFVVILFFTPFPSLFKAAPHDFEFWFAVAASVPLIGLTSLLTQAHVRQGTLVRISWRQFVERLAVLVFSLLFVSSAHGLVWAQIVGYAVSLFILWPGSRVKMRSLVHNSRAQLLQTFRDYRDFPFKNGASSIFQIITAQFPAVILSMFYPASQLGLLGLAQRIIDMPNTIILSSGSTIYYRRLIQARREDLRRLFWLCVKVSLPALLLPFLLAGLTAPFWLTRLFGQQWAPAVPFFMVLCPLGFLRLIYTLQANILIVLRRMDLDLRISVGLMFGQFIGLGIGCWLGLELLWPVALGSTLAAVCYLTGVVLIHQQTRRVQRPN